MAYAQRRNTKLTGRWIADAEYKNADGSVDRWHGKVFASKQEAEGAEAYFRATGQKPAHLLAGAPTESYEAVAKRYAQRNPKWMAEQANRQRLDMSIQRLGKLDVKMVRKRQLEDYVDYLLKHTGRRGSPPANRTINRYLDAVANVLSAAVSDELILARPEMPRMPDVGEERPAATRESENRICGWLSEHGYDDIAFIVRVLSGTGMREGQLYKLKPEQIGNSCIVHGRIDTKTKKYSRECYIPPESARKLRAIIASGSMPKQNHLQHTFKKAVRALGEDDRLCPHSLRHSTVTRMLESGASVLDVQKLVGHSVIMTTGRYYHPDIERKQEVAEKAHLWNGETPQTADIVSFQPIKKAQ